MNHYSELGDLPRSEVISITEPMPRARLLPSSGSLSSAIIWVYLQFLNFLNSFNHHLLEVQW